MQTESFSRLHRPLDVSKRKEQNRYNLDDSISASLDIESNGTYVVIALKVPQRGVSAQDGHDHFLQLLSQLLLLLRCNVCG